MASDWTNSPRIWKGSAASDRGNLFGTAIKTHHDYLSPIIPIICLENHHRIQHRARRYQPFHLFGKLLYSTVLADINPPKQCNPS